jgi:hypothetical protein
MWPSKNRGGRNWIQILPTQKFRKFLKSFHCVIPENGATLVARFIRIHGAFYRLDLVMDSGFLPPSRAW